MKVSAIALLAGIAAMLLLAGCSGGDSGAGAAPGPPPGGVKMTPVATPPGAGGLNKLGG